MKYHPHGSVLFITFSLEEGLLLLCNPLCEEMLKSCLASAQAMYPVSICHYLISGNHVHLIIVVNNPDDVSGFIRYFKTESAHALNGILGREKRTVWCEGYDSPIVLTPVRTLIAIAYLYSNPAKDDLEDSIELYPGLSSWNAFRSGICTFDWKRIRRPAYQALKSGEDMTRAAQRMYANIKKTCPFTLTPNAWMGAFGITDQEQQEKLNGTIVNHIRHVEERSRLKRAKAGKRVLGRSKLQTQRFNLTYRSKRDGKRMWCLGEVKADRVRFITFLKDLFTKARRVTANWKLGDFSERFPLGLYPPSFPKLAEPISVW